MDRIGGRTVIVEVPIIKEGVADVLLDLTVLRLDERREEGCGSAVYESASDHACWIGDTKQPGGVQASEELYVKL